MPSEEGSCCPRRPWAPPPSPAAPTAQGKLHQASIGSSSGIPGARLHWVHSPLAWQTNPLASRLATTQASLVLTPSSAGRAC